MVPFSSCHHLYFPLSLFFAIVVFVRCHCLPSSSPSLSHAFVIHDQCCCSLLSSLLHGVVISHHVLLSSVFTGRCPSLSSVVGRSLPLLSVVCVRGGCHRSCRRYCCQYGRKTGPWGGGHTRGGSGRGKGRGRGPGSGRGRGALFPHFPLVNVRPISLHCGHGGSERGRGTLLLVLISGGCTHRFTTL